MCVGSLAVVLARLYVVLYTNFKYKEAAPASRLESPLGNGQAYK